MTPPIIFLSQHLEPQSPNDASKVLEQGLAQNKFASSEDLPSCTLFQVVNNENTTGLLCSIMLCLNHIMFPGTNSTELLSTEKLCLAYLSRNVFASGRFSAKCGLIADTFAKQYYRLSSSVNLDQVHKFMEVNFLKNINKKDDLISKTLLNTTRKKGLLSLIFH